MLELERNKNLIMEQLREESREDTLADHTLYQVTDKRGAMMFHNIHLNWDTPSKRKQSDDSDVKFEDNQSPHSTILEQTDDPDNTSFVANEEGGD